MPIIPFGFYMNSSGNLVPISQHPVFQNGMPGPNFPLPEVPLPPAPGAPGGPPISTPVEIGVGPGIHDAGQREPNLVGGAGSPGRPSQPPVLINGNGVQVTQIGAQGQTVVAVNIPQGAVPVNAQGIAIAGEFAGVRPPVGTYTFQVPQGAIVSISIGDPVTTANIYRPGIQATTGSVGTSTIRPGIVMPLMDGVTHGSMYIPTSQITPIQGGGFYVTMANGQIYHVPAGGLIGTATGNGAGMNFVGPLSGQGRPGAGILTNTGVRPQMRPVAIGQNPIGPFGAGYLQVIPPRGETNALPFAPAPIPVTGPLGNQFHDASGQPVFANPPLAVQQNYLQMQNAMNQIAIIQTAQSGVGPAGIRPGQPFTVGQFNQALQELGINPNQSLQAIEADLQQALQTMVGASGFMFGFGSGFGSAPQPLPPPPGPPPPPP